MKYQYPRFQEALSPTIRIVLITGDDPLLRDETRQAFSTFAHQQGHTGTVRLYVEPSWDVGTLYNALEPTLFDPKKLITLNVEGKWPSELTQALDTIIARDDPDTYIVIVGPKLTAAQTKSKWVKTIEKMGAHVVIWPIDAQRFPLWVNNRASALGLKLDHAATRLLCEYTENNTLACQQALEKLALLFPDQTIDQASVETQLVNAALYTPYDLVYAALEQNHEKMTAVCHFLKAQKTEPYVCLIAACQTIRQLIQAYEHLHQASPTTALKKVGVWQKHLPIMETALRQYSCTLMKRLLTHAYILECEFKGLSTGHKDAWFSLQQWLNLLQPR